MDFDSAANVVYFDLFDAFHLAKSCLYSPKRNPHTRLTVGQNCMGFRLVFALLFRILKTWLLKQ